MLPHAIIPPPPFLLKNLIVSVLTIIIVSLYTMIMQVQMLTVGVEIGGGIKQGQQGTKYMYNVSMHCARM